MPDAPPAGDRSPDGLGALVFDAAASVADPELRRSLGELGMVRGAVVVDGVATVDIALTVVGCPAADRIEREVRESVTRVAGIQTVEVRLQVMEPEERRALIQRVRGERRSRFGEESLTRVVAIGSGKGGVGKSTITANLAVALARRGLRVGVMDLDVHGFSIPGLLGIAGQRPNRVEGLVMPPEGYGVPVISIGMFTEGSEPVSWRGPMLHRTIEQFLSDVWFGDLDLLLVDLPPGTGDIALSFGQLVPQAEFVVVTTPQPAAADVAVRAGLLARQLGQRLTGVVENMGPLTTMDGQVIDLFGSGGGQAVADRLSLPEQPPVPLLGSVPLSPALRMGGDAGAPIVVTAPTDPAAQALTALAGRIATSAPSRLGRSLLG